METAGTAQGYVEEYERGLSPAVDVSRLMMMMVIIFQASLFKSSFSQRELGSQLR